MTKRVLTTESGYQVRPLGKGKEGPIWHVTTGRGSGMVVTVRLLQEILTAIEKAESP